MRRYCWVGPPCFLRNCCLNAPPAEKGADINSKNKHGNTPLQSNVAHNASIEFLAYLIDKGADINNTNHQGTTPLEEAVKGFSLPAVSVLLKHGARTFPTTTEASDSGKIGLLPLLVHRDGDGNTIIHKAASSMEFAHCLAGLFSLRDESSVEEGEKLFLSSNSKGDTPLHCALRYTNSNTRNYNLVHQY